MGKLLAALFFVGTAGAQPPDGTEAKNDVAIESARSKDEKHILGVVPNYMTVNDPSKSHGPLTPGQKFIQANHDTFDPFNWVIAGVYAGVYQAQNTYPQWKQGGAAYAKRYGATFADGAVSSYLSEGVLPTLLHEDPRYFRMGGGSKWRRAAYAMSRVLITKTDAGKLRFNNSEIEGNLIAASLGNLYYPSGSRSAGDTFDKFGINVVSDAGFNVLREFWPDMRRRVLHR
ncbi:MAG TPA: hypothetical protein VKX39_03935 [Bryobacteraceae bacterium]|jgi:hypothetical protein|nr:hypothetical protein [Bryobacteraceae bacterium]